MKLLLHDIKDSMLPEFENTKIAFQYKSTPHLRQAQILFKSMGSPMLTAIGMIFTKWAINIHLPITRIIKNTIFRQFCGGENMEEAAATIDMLGHYNMGVIMDYGVEGKEGESEFDNAVPEFIKAISYAASKKNVPFISLKITGFARFALLEKIHGNTPLNPQEEEEWKRVFGRIGKICHAAHQQGIMVLVDAEETWIQEGVNRLTEAMMEAYNKEQAIIFNTFQFYTVGALEYLMDCHKAAKAKGYLLGAKLVRGAYMEKERKRAAEHNYPSPIQPDKEHTDTDYNKALAYCLQNIKSLAVFIGTHNESSCMIAAKFMEQLGIPHNDGRVYFSQLFGMSDNISFNLAKTGFNVAKYLPYGPVKDVIPYLMRRAQENTSVAGQTGRELSLINKELKRRKTEKNEVR